jgi:hypothetical protein
MLHQAEWIQMARSLYRKGFNDEEVSVQLREKGIAETMLQEIIRQVKKLRSSKKKKAGFIFCGIGIFFLIAGCMFTLLLYNSGANIRPAMYGLTGLGLVFTIKGMIDLLGW